MESAPDECPACGGALPPGGTRCFRCGWTMPLASAPYPPPLDFTNPPAGPIARREQPEEYDESEDDDVDEEDDDEGFWTATRVVRLALVIVLVIVIYLVLSR